MNTLQSFNERDAHVFDVTFEKGAAVVLHGGQIIGRTRSGAIHLAARWLLAEGLAQPHHWMVTMIGDVPSQAGQVGGCAQWRVRENDEGLHLVRYVEAEIERLNRLEAIA